MRESGRGADAKMKSQTLAPKRMRTYSSVSEYKKLAREPSLMVEHSCGGASETNLAARWKAK